MFGDIPSEVIGIGTVLLPVKKSTKLKGSGSDGALLLTNVLHMPTAVSNVIGHSAMDDYELRLPTGTDSFGEFVNLHTGGTAALIGRGAGDSSQFSVVKLSGPPVGPRTGPQRPKTGILYSLSVEWPPEERHKWLPSAMSTTVGKPEGESLTPLERKWLKSGYGGEFHFLNVHGLSIYKDDDREQGRSIMRAMMEADENSDMIGLVAEN